MISTITILAQITLVYPKSHFNNKVGILIFGVSSVPAEEAESHSFNAVVFGY